MKYFFIMLITFLVISCNSNQPKPIKLNTENCEFCKMTIASGKFGAELITTKGRYYKFDDVACMLQYAKSNQILVKMFFVNDYSKENELIPAEKSFFLKGGTISSPMRGNIATFSTSIEQKEFQTKLKAEAMTWEQVYNSY